MGDGKILRAADVLAADGGGAEIGVALADAGVVIVGA